MVKEFDPDFLVDFSSGLPHDIAQEIDQKILNTTDFFFEDDQDKQKGYRISLRTYGAFLDELPESGLSDNKKEKLSLIKAKYNSDSLFFAFRYGLLDKHLSPDIVEFVENKLELPSATLTFAQYAKLDKTKYIGPIAITKSQLRNMGGGGGFSGSLIYVGNHKVRDDLIEYWNLRASGRDVFFLPVDKYKLFKKSIKSYIDGTYIDERFNQIDLDLQIAPSLIKNVRKFEEIADWVNKINIGISKRMWLANWGRRSKRVSPDINCITPLYSREKIPVNYSKDEISSFTASSPQFIDDLFYKENAWAINLSFIGFYENDYVIDLPNQEGMQDLAKRDLMVGGWDHVRVSNNGLVYYPDSKDDIITIRPVKTDRVVDIIFDKIGFKRRPSPPGIFSQKILQLMDGLEGCRVFKIKGVRDALAVMNRDEGEVIVDGKKIKGEIAKARPMTASCIKEIIKRTKDDCYGSKNWIKELYENLVLYSGQPKPLNAETILNYLITKRLISPGRKFKCTNCSCEEWYK
ncbi:MAG: hypothetical protein ACYC0D_09620, partial [Candidatus Humimicrobiaceae bacterium]